MKIEAASTSHYEPVLPAAPLRAPTYSVESVLVPPQAPTFPLASKFFNWVWSWLRPLFSPFLPKEEPPPPIALDVVRTIQLAEAKKHAPWPITIAAKQATVAAVKWSVPIALQGSISWYLGQLPTFVGNQSVKYTKAAIEQIAKYTLPNISRLWVEGASLAISSASVWYAADRLGYPLGYIFLGLTVVNIAMLNSNIQKEAAQKRKQLSQMRMTGLVPS